MTLTSGFSSLSLGKKKEIYLLKIVPGTGEMAEFRNTGCSSQQRAQLQFPAPACQFRTLCNCNSSPRGPDSLFCPLLTPGANVYSSKILIQIFKNVYASNGVMAAKKSPKVRSDECAVDGVSVEKGTDVKS